MIRYTCPKCNAMLQSPDNREGVKIDCPACTHKVRVPPPVHVQVHRARRRSRLKPVVIFLLALGGGVLLGFEAIVKFASPTPVQQTNLSQEPVVQHPKGGAKISSPGPMPVEKSASKGSHISKQLPVEKSGSRGAQKSEQLLVVPHLKGGAKISSPGTQPVEKPGFTVKAPQVQTSGVSRIDEFVLVRLKEKGIVPAPTCADEVFVRRVFLDVIGTLPTAQEAKDFLKDTDPKKRCNLIDRLLERKEFADYWAMKWGDILRVKSEFPINLWPNAVRVYHHWIRTSVRENLPYDQFARALLTSSGSNFRAPPVNFYRAVQRKDAMNCARAVALTFMGVRPQAWPQERWSGMATFFSQVGYKSTREWKEEIVFFDSSKPLSFDKAMFPDGTKASFLPDQDPRLVFADWLIRPDNPWFTRNIANRAWSWLIGRGIIHEPDDIRPDNPPSNPELLAYLEQELISGRYNLKHLFRLILNSKTYQQSCRAASEHPEAAALFASYPLRRLEAEVLIDAICQITGTTERYNSPIPEPFTFLPEGCRAISLPDASITSAFLEMFGRSPRDTGLESERNNKLTAAQKLHLLNSAHIQKKIEQGPGLAGLLELAGTPEKLTEQLYLTILSRYPTQDELAEIVNHTWGGSRARAVDIAWALLNSAEFMMRH